MDCIERLAVCITLLSHALLGQLNVFCVHGILGIIEEEIWPWVEEHLEDYLDEREDFYEELKARDEGLELIWEDEEGLGFDVLD